MTRAEVKRRLALAWWQYLAVGLLPLPVMSWAFGGGEALFGAIARFFYPLLLNTDPVTQVGGDQAL